MSDNTNETPEPTSQELTIPDNFTNANRLPDETLNRLQSTSDVAELFNELNAELEDYAGTYGSGFEILDKKERLVDVPFLVVEWSFHKSAQYGGHFVSALVITERGDKFIVNDGSTGIRDQLFAVTQQRAKRGLDNTQNALAVRKGLRRSEYEYVDENTGESRRAVTFYLGK